GALRAEEEVEPPREVADEALAGAVRAVDGDASPVADAGDHAHPARVERIGDSPRPRAEDAAEHERREPRRREEVHGPELEGVPRRVPRASRQRARREPAADVAPEAGEAPRHADGRA